MLITRYGRVSVDPMRVPVAARMDHGRTEAFADTLAQIERTPEPTAQPAEQIGEQAAEPGVAEPEVAATDVANPSANDVERADDPAPAAALAAQSNTPSRGEPARRITADEGAGAPLDSLAPLRRQPASATTSHSHVPLTVARALVAAALPAGAATAVAATRVRQGHGEARIGALESTPPARAPSAKVAVQGYRLLNAPALQLDEQARDSVFKQILWKLTKDGGEMRVRLQPPELGELDLHLAVENGNQLRLSIGAERPELRQLLTGNLHELTQQLAAAGLEVTHAEVHARQQGEPRREQGQQRAPRAPHEDDAETAATPRIGTGWYGAQGLDFWV